MRKLLLGLLTVLLTMVMIAPAALAADVQRGSRLTIGPTETLEDDLIYTGVSLVIDGTIKGDVYAFTDNVTVNGTIEGNLIFVGRTLDVRGRVAGSTFAGGDDLLVTGNIGGSLLTAADVAEVSQEAVIGRNWLAFGDQVRLTGQVGRGVTALSAILRIDGSVAREVWANVEQLEIGSEAEIGGSVEYLSPEEASIAPGAKTGEVFFEREEPWYYWDDEEASYFGTAIGFGGFLIVGMILLSLFPQLRFRFHHAVLGKPWQAPLVGLAILVMLPIAAVLLLITLVGIPVSLLTMLVYPVAIYFGQVLLAWTAGRLIADRWEWLGRQHWALLFLVGAIATTLLTSIPFVGGTLGFIAVLYGLGGLFYAYAHRKPAQIA